MYTEVILTLLTVVTGILTILTFANSRRKDSNEQSKNIGVIEQKIDNINKRTEAIQTDVKDLREKYSITAQTLMSVQESTKSAHKRIDRVDRSVAYRKDA